MFGIIFIILAIGAIALGLWTRQMSLKVASWPQIEGKIIASTLEQDPHDADSSPRIVYQYEIDGRRYEGSQITYAGTSNSVDAKQALVARYPVGRCVNVYYNPEAPQSAVLENEPSSIWLGLVVTGIVFFIVGVIVR
jgi:hypothetical protein